MQKILTVVGARPQFVKAATLSRAFANHPDHVKEIIVHTGQHFDQNMSDIFFDEMDIPKPDYNLNINGLSHGAMTGQMLEGIEKIIISDKPGCVLVYGDTNSTLAGALAAKKLHVAVVHIEAGLRSYNMQMPEEINRILTDRISDILFCPTDTAVNNLKSEGFDSFKTEIVLSGDVMHDAALYYKAKSDKQSNVLKENRVRSGEFVLATIHRAENTDNEKTLQEIVHALNKINESVQVIVPVHPRTAGLLKAGNIDAQFSMIKPVGYLDMLQLISNARLVLTDSGGLQKEAYFFGKHCLTLRNETEWVELVNNGYNDVVGTSFDRIIEAFDNSINKTFIKSRELYGTGNAAEIICDYLLQKAWTA